MTRTLGLKGLDDISATFLGRIFEVLLALFGTALSGLAFGAVASAFVTASDQETYVPASALTDMRVATLKCSTLQTFLREVYMEAAELRRDTDPDQGKFARIAQGLACSPPTNPNNEELLKLLRELDEQVVLVDNWQEALALLNDGDVDAILGDWAALTFHARGSEYAGRIAIQDQVYRNEPLGWAVSRRAPEPNLVRRIDMALLGHVRESSWRDRLEDALGEGTVSPN